MKTVLPGLFLTAVVTGLAYASWGRGAIVGSASFGMLAVAIQVVAVTGLKQVWHGEFAIVMKRFGMGIALRFGGIVVFAVAVSVRPDIFVPLPSAVGFVGVLVPLLYMELKLVR